MHPKGSRYLKNSVIGSLPSVSSPLKAMTGVFLKQKLGLDTASRAPWRSGLLTRTWISSPGCAFSCRYRRSRPSRVTCTPEATNTENRFTERGNLLDSSLKSSHLLSRLLADLIQAARRDVIHTKPPFNPQTVTIETTQRVESKSLMGPIMVYLFFSDLSGSAFKKKHKNNNYSRCKRIKETSMTSPVPVPVPLC